MVAHRLHVAVFNGNLSKAFEERRGPVTTNKKQHIEIPKELRVEVLFASDRTCCVCRVKGKPTQIHHIDDNPAHNVFENLAVLCFDCHNLTQVRGGFHNKLDAAQVLRYRDDWLNKVAKTRETWWLPSTDAEAKVIEKPISAAAALKPRLETWGDSVLAKLREFTFIWTSIYGKKHERLVDPFLGDLQNKFSIMSEQLVITLSESPKEASSKIIQYIGSIATQLSELGTKQFYIDGGKSVGEFNDLGDNTIKLAEDVIAQINSSRDEEELA